MSRLRLLIGSRVPVRPPGASRATAGSSRFEVVAHARNGTEVLRKVLELRPDVVLVHIDLQGLDAIAPTSAIAPPPSRVRALLLCLHVPSSDPPPLHVLATLCTYALDTTDLDAVAHVVDGDHARLCPYAKLERSGRRSPALRVKDSLTPREREVLGYVAREKTSREIGGELGISPRTVDAHRANVMKKLNIHTVAGLTRYALERGMLDPEARP